MAYSTEEWNALTQAEKDAALAGEAYEGTGAPADYTSVTRTRPATATVPDSILAAALVKPEGSTTDNRGITGTSSAGAAPTTPSITAGPSPSEIFKSWNRTGAEVGGTTAKTMGQARGASTVRGNMADALRIGTKTAARAATPRTLDRKKQRNTLGLNINPGIGLQV